MPSRILREGILTSERVNSLSWEAEVFYRRLMSVVDDFGRFSAHPQILRAALYPLKLDSIRDANIERLLAANEQASLVRVYVVSGKRYLELLDFKQQVRAKESKYPHPPNECAADATQMHNKCAADAHVDGGGCGDVIEDVDDNPPTTARDEAFQMTLNWKPSPHFATLVRQSGLPIPGNNDFAAALGEFVAYWLSQSRKRTQHEWDHALVKSLKAEKLRVVSPKVGRKTLSETRAETIAGLTGPSKLEDENNERDITAVSIRIA